MKLVDEHGKIHVVDVIRICAWWVFCITGLSMIVFAFTGFALIHPFFCLLTQIAAGTFWVMARKIVKAEKETEG